MTDGDAPIETTPLTIGHTIRRWARWYDLVSWIISLGRIGRVRRTAIRIAQLEPDISVLDIGCGTGSLALDLHQSVGAGGQVSGIDASPEMIDVARNKAAGRGAPIDLRLGTAENLPYAEGQFDRVVSTFVFHHLPAALKRDAVDEIGRVLKPTGSVLIVDFAVGGGPLLHRLAAMLLGGHSHAGAAELTRLLEEAGFEGVSKVQTDHRGIDFVRGHRPAD